MNYTYNHALVLEVSNYISLTNMSGELAACFFNYMFDKNVDEHLMQM